MGEELQRKRETRGPYLLPLLLLLLPPLKYYTFAVAWGALPRVAPAVVALAAAAAADAVGEAEG